MKYGKVGIERVLVPVPLDGITTLYDGAFFTRPMAGDDPLLTAEPDEHAANKRKLLIGAAMCTGFMLTEIIGGWLAGSLAVMTDAAHMLSDVAGCVLPLKCSAAVLPAARVAAALRATRVAAALPAARVAATVR